jgi:hypothetical protein
MQQFTKNREFQTEVKWNTPWFNEGSEFDKIPLKKITAGSLCSET